MATKNKNTIIDDKKYNFDIFKNYTCDGQLVMEFNGAEINIREEEKVNKVAKLST